ncbi:uncharacterized protein SPAPADRAFT_59329 [Spathaspora passalidarum NRRL Y-27907]|uniref:Arf-GAP domain-containing protein n=1 Tax=Spathaspora passalidarum (strain NRRL Y-27907 / 11-Y1) TaxID=619300 RepID=G3AJN9_SPAPN|nr:uncharacterized protein SPAPADRAFT_59329 [Spathaspora passalidarum NRRL Y-27907]EGW33940.1 hypothetical protein SPAPADRAFT_59329 [Spathaspora passalidarum NRRL Y-27907]
MSYKKHQKDVEKQLIDIVNSRGNDNKCGECGTPFPTWASYNLGIFLCGRCASIHKRVLGPPHYDISRVKSLTLDTWSDQQIANLRKVGNKRAKRKWNSKNVPFPYDGDDDIAAVEQYIRDKYINGKFRDDNIDPSDFEDRESRYSDDQVSRRSRSNSAVSRAPIPRLSHRKLTTFENGQYPVQVSKIMSFGYNDRETVLESLLLSNGNIESALDILEQDAKINPNKTEIPPSLPRRPPSSSITSASTTPAATGASSLPPQTQPSSDEWWNTSNSAPAVPGATPQNATPQIYQYTDPITGQISYIDSNGQEYLDPNNPQHQQQLMQLANPQLMAQQTNKQNILSLYNQPNQFTTNVAVPVSAQQQQQQQQVHGQPQNPAFNAQPSGFAPQVQSQYGQQQINAFAQQPQQPQQYQQQPQFTGFQYGQPGQSQQGYWNQ